jgi:CRISPR system Cascade subunit CasD
MSVLMLRLAGPMQSWGTQSRFIVRDTGLEPSKSGVVGLLCAALGWPRDREQFPVNGHDMAVEQLARSVRMGVRVDRSGTVACDYHTAGGERRAGSMLGHDDKGKPIAYAVPTADGKASKTVVSHRYYLADADFLVALEADPTLLTTIANAVAAPAWPVFLGRKSFVPGRPVYTGQPVDDELTHALETTPWPQRPNESPPDQLRVVMETDFGVGPEVRHDVPLSFARRSFAPRHVETRFIPVPAVEDDPCCI